MSITLNGSHALTDLEDPLWVKLPTGRYPIYVGYGLLEKPQCFEATLKGKKVFILSHPEIARIYLPSLEKTCYAAGATEVSHALVPSGDYHKTLETAANIWSALLAQGYHRDSVLITLGGGMINDLGGFCAACYLRGIKVIHCPTTLLAQVDAAIGGKTGVNHVLGKNLIGAFHQPQTVVADLSTLSTLPQREFISGLAELIKYGLTLDPPFFNWLESHIIEIMQRQPDALNHAVKQACQLKAAIVASDEKEEGQQRIVLNFGHTVAHALESILDYKQCLHGEAVAIGMIVAIRLSMEHNTVDGQLLERVMSLLKTAGLPTTLPPGITPAEILAKMKYDKKHGATKLNWVLLKALGQAFTTHATASHVIQALTATRVGTP